MLAKAKREENSDNAVSPQRADCFLALIALLERPPCRPEQTKRAPRTVGFDASILKTSSLILRKEKRFLHKNNSEYKQNSTL